MNFPLKHYLVTGRICGHDEDTTLTFMATSKQEAIDAYTSLMWSQDRASPEERWLLEACDRGVFINGVFVSDSPITQAE